MLEESAKSTAAIERKGSDCIHLIFQVHECIWSGKSNVYS